MRKNSTKGVVQPIVREDGSVAITDEEIFSGDEVKVWERIIGHQNL